MAIQWKDSDTKDRLLAAVIAASSDLKMNEIARVFGQGATYDAVEGQLRKAKKLAKELKEEAEGRGGPAETPSRAKKTKNVNTSPVKTPVKGARVTKPKKATTPKIKAELLEEDSMLFDAAEKGAGCDDAEDEV